MFRYRAIRRNSNNNVRWYLFKLKDCPALLWEDSFFLAGKPGTPVMYYDTIVRGHPSINMFEGDRVIDKSNNNVLGIVVYNNGFYMQKVGTNIKKSIPEGHIYVSRGDSDSVKDLKSFERTPIQFKYLNQEFDLSDLVSVEGDVLNIMINGKIQKVNLNAITELLYYDKTEEYKGYKGDIFKGKFLSIDNIASIG